MIPIALHLDTPVQHLPAPATVSARAANAAPTHANEDDNLNTKTLSHEGAVWLPSRLCDLVVSLSSGEFEPKCGIIETMISQWTRWKRGIYDEPR